MSQEDRELIARGVRPDSKNRVSLGAAVADLDEDAFFNVYRDKQGRIILEPRASVPAAEAWLFRNKTALESVKRGLEEAAQGETKIIGSFSKYSDEKP